MNDDQDLAAVRGALTTMLESLGEVRMQRPAETLAARGRRRRLRHVLSGLVAAGAALGIGLVLALPSGSHPGRAGPPASGRPVHVNLAAWSVNDNPDGTVILTIRRLNDAPALRRVLARAGVPAAVYFGEKTCQADRYRLTGDAVSETPAGVLIRPQAIPKGWELNLSVLKPVPSPKNTAEWAADLVPIGAHLTCTRPHAR